MRPWDEATAWLPGDVAVVVREARADRRVAVTVVRAQVRGAPPHRVRLEGVALGSDTECAAAETRGFRAVGSGCWEWESWETADPLGTAN